MTIDDQVNALVARLIEPGLTDAEIGKIEKKLEILKDLD